MKTIKKSEIDDSPFTLKSPKAKGIHWLKPKWAAEVEFSMWTRDGRLRVPVFKGLRTDKAATEIKREIPKSIAETASLEPLPLTHPDKILFKKEKITKQQVAEYYSFVTKWMLPQISHRPLSLKRCPEGTEKTCFYQKHVVHSKKGSIQKNSPLHEVSTKEKSGTKKYITIDSKEGLQFLIQMNAFELHAWGCRDTDVEHPDAIVMDFDPDPSVPFSKVKKAAFELKKTLEKLRLKSFLKVTGGKGLHVHIPVDPIYSWDQIKSFSKTLADEMVSRFPKEYVSVASKKERQSKIFIDYLRNGRSATAVAPYSLRARPFSSVALPISWAELSTLKSSDQFSLSKAITHLKKRKQDPWKKSTLLRQKIKILENIPVDMEA